MSRTDSDARTIAAPAAVVFSALVSRDALETWLPPDGMTGTFERFEPRVGGGYRLELRYADPSTTRGKTSAGADVVEVRFVEVVPGERVVQAVDFVSDDPANAGTMTMTWSLQPVDGGTRVEIRAENVPAGISAEDHAAGLRSSLDQLAAYVTR